MRWLLAVILALLMATPWAKDVVKYVATGVGGTVVVIMSSDCVSPVAKARLAAELRGAPFSAQAAVIKIKDQPEMAGCWVGVSFDSGQTIIVITGEDGGIMYTEPSDFRLLTNT